MGVRGRSGCHEDSTTPQGSAEGHTILQAKEEWPRERYVLLALEEHGVPIQVTLRLLQPLL